MTAMKKLDMAKIKPLVDLAVAEDLGTGDVTSQLLFPDDGPATGNPRAFRDSQFHGLA